MLSEPQQFMILLFAKENAENGENAPFPLQDRTQNESSFTDRVTEGGRW